MKLFLSISVWTPALNFIIIYPVAVVLEMDQGDEHTQQFVQYFQRWSTWMGMPHHYEFILNS
jgi:hypothetical protein